MKIKWFKNIKTYDELKKAYRDLMKKYHPDLNPDKQEECTEIAKEINNEFSYLFDKLPNERKNKEGETIGLDKSDLNNLINYFNTCKKILDYKNQKLTFTLEI